MIGFKNTKGKKLSSSNWLKRQARDPFVRQARKFGYRSRAAYKLIEINEKFKFLFSGNSVIDLGSAPGGWSQVAAKIVGSEGRVFAIDFLEMLPIPNVKFFHQSIEDCLEHFLNIKVDVVISDMAPSASGNNELDHMRSMNLCNLALDFSKFTLKKGGTMLMKILQGFSEKELLDNLKQSFKLIKYVKPKCSRKESAEIYIIAQGFYCTQNPLENIH